MHVYQNPVLYTCFWVVYIKTGLSARLIDFCSFLLSEIIKISNIKGIQEVIQKVYLAPSSQGNNATDNGANEMNINNRNDKNIIENIVENFSLTHTEEKAFFQELKATGHCLTTKEGLNWYSNFSQVLLKKLGLIKEEEKQEEIEVKVVTFKNTDSTLTAVSKATGQTFEKKYIKGQETAKGWKVGKKQFG